MDIRATKLLSGVTTTHSVVREPVLAGREVEAVPPEAKLQPERPVVKDPRDPQEAVSEHLGDYLRSSDRDLEFRVDGGTHATVITVRNGETGDIVRQIPNETALRLMRLLNAEPGTLVDLTA